MVSGLDHIQQYYANDYRTVPTIGRLFVLNFVTAVVVAAALYRTDRRVAGRYAGVIRAVLAVAGIGIAVLSLGALFVSESSSLFGFVVERLSKGHRRRDRIGGRRRSVPFDLPRRQLGGTSTTRPSPQ